MQKLLALLLVATAVSGEAPYPASGWKPDGPAFDLPQRGEQPQNYLPPVDPRNPRTNVDLDSPDVSVQGLPAAEPAPQFQLSPVSGQQYQGGDFQKDLKTLDERYRQQQYQQQQQRLRQLARQQQEYSAPAQAATNKPAPLPRQFAQPPPSPKQQKTTTESLKLNTGEVLDSQKTTPANLKGQKVSVEITKQQIQEYPPELFLGPLAQLRLQSVRSPGQSFAQLIYQPSLQEAQKQTAIPAFDGVANLGLVQSILAQNQQQSAALTAQLTPRERQPNQFILISSANQYQPLSQQYQIQPLLLPAQLNLEQTQNDKQEPEVRDVENDDGNDDEDEKTKQAQPGFVGQPQYVPQQPQLVPQQQYVPQQQQFVPQQQQFVPQSHQFVPQEQQQFVPRQQQFLPQSQQFIPQEQQQFVPQQQQFVPQQQQQFVPQPQQFVPQQQQFVPQQQQQFVPQPQQFIPQQQQFVPQQQQFVVEQPQSYQPQEISYQAPNPAQLNYQPTNEDINMYYQQQQLLLQQQQLQLLVQEQQAFQRQNQPQGIQSDIGDGQKNTLEQTDREQENDGQNNGSVATAVATAFGDRSRPRVLPGYAYGSPLTTPQPTAETELQDEATTTEGSVVAEATAVARGNRRKSAKLRARRVRPIFGVDKSGHLVQLMQEQQQ